MPRRSYRPEQIINKLREAEVLLCQGSTIGEAARKIGVTEQAYYRWRREYGGMSTDEVKQPKELEPDGTYYLNRIQGAMPQSITCKPSL